MAIDTKWRGSAAAIKYILPILFLSSLTAWILGVAYTAHLERARGEANDDYANYRSSIPSTAEIFFYSSGVPMASMLAAAIDLLLFFFSLLHPIVSIIWGVISYGLWVYILTTWAVCEYSADMGGDGCPNLYVFDYTRVDVWETSYWYGRLVTGGLASVMVLVQLSLAARAVHLARRESKIANRKEAS